MMGVAGVSRSQVNLQVQGYNVMKLPPDGGEGTPHRGVAEMSNRPLNRARTSRVWPSTRFPVLCICTMTPDVLPMPCLSRHYVSVFQDDARFSLRNILVVALEHA